MNARSPETMKLRELYRETVFRTREIQFRNTFS
jgi:hypothetical protein